MKAGVLLAAVVVAASAISATAVTPDYQSSKFKVLEKVPIKARPFSLEEVKLLDSPFKAAMDADEKWLLELEPDRLLSGFRSEAGLKPKAEKYGGWESQGLAGHCLGHYLSACSLMYASTGDKRFLDKVNYVVGELDECQKALGTGYISAIPNGKQIFADAGAGKIQTANFSLNGGWSPWYTEHKVFAGLRDAYLYCNNETAKSVVAKFGDWAFTITENLSEEQFQKMMECEFGGMNEILTDVYAITGDIKYLQLAMMFNHYVIVDPLAKGEDPLTGKHANTQIPKLVGSAREYEIIGDKRYLRASNYFWDVVTKERSYVIGGNSAGEYFTPKETLSKAVTSNTSETCNTYNMLKLTRELFCLEPKAEYADYYEPALYNHILASQNPETGRVTYFVPLKSGSQKDFCDGFECCVGTGWENHAKYGDSIYFHNNKTELYVNLFIPSELNWKSNGMKVKQETSYPEDNKTTLTFICDRPVGMLLNLRVPAWATSGIQVTLNGQKQVVTAKPGTYITIRRTWKTGDKVVMTMPMSLHTESFKDDPRKVAFLYGPLVLCSETDPTKEIPVVVSSMADVISSIKPVEGSANTFTLPASLLRTFSGDKKEMKLIPFYKEYKNPYMVYWDLFSADQWKTEEASYKAELDRQKELETRTIDEMRFEMQPERDHELKSDKSRTGDESYNGKLYKWRDAYDGGYISFKMKVDPAKPMDLLCTYWGASRRARTFDILIDDKKLVSENITADNGEKPCEVTYAIPAEMVSGKSTVTVTFRTEAQKSMGRCMGCRIVSRKVVTQEVTP